MDGRGNADHLERCPAVERATAHPMNSGQGTPAFGAPLVVHLGFAGSRDLYGPSKHEPIDEAKFHKEIEDHLVAIMAELPKTLGLSEHHFLCCISQLDIGADRIFTRACARLAASHPERSFAQRIFLPDSPDAYLDAGGNSNRSQRTEGRRLMASPHILEERIVGFANDREERSEEASLEVVRVSDLVIALVREGEMTEPGNPAHFITRARARNKYVLLITVSVRAGRTEFEDKWLPRAPRDRKGRKDDFEPPNVPKAIAGFVWQKKDTYSRELGKFAGNEAKRHQRLFKFAALIIILTHVVATIIASYGLAIHKAQEAGVPESQGFRGPAAMLLVCEFGLLAWGFVKHNQLYDKQTVEQWATSRLVAEVARSVTAVREVRGYLQHLFHLPMPETLRHLMRTLNFFHLQETQKLGPQDWEKRRANYIYDRLNTSRKKEKEKKGDGQIRYYYRQQVIEGQWLESLHDVFSYASRCAIVFVLIKLGLTACHDHPWEGLENFLGFLTIVLPIIAVAALSLAASFDFEARRHTYREMVAALRQKRVHLRAALTEKNFPRWRSRPRRCSSAKTSVGFRGGCLRG